MTTEQLLAPRFEVIADYPESPYKIGQIEYADTWTDDTNDGLHLYPAIFKPLQWWERREEKDLPQYIRWKSGKVDKVSSWDINYDNEGETVFSIGEYSYYADDSISPSTIEEYNEYIKSKP